MYSDLFDQLGGGGGRAGSGRPTARAAAPSGPPPLVSLKAGKMLLEKKPDSSSYQCTPDTKRGEIRLLYKDGALQWQWYDRRDKLVVDSHILPISAGPAGTFERVPLTGTKHALDRIYVWTHADTAAYDMYWMQDASEEKEDELVAQINQYLADPASAVPATESVTSSNNAPGATATTATAGTTEGGGISSSHGTAAAISSSTSLGAGDTSQTQVDALSSILQNLGMPQQGGSSDTSSNNGGGTLTLADLQGAMASMQQQQASPPTEIVPLTEVVTPAAITALLEHQDVKQRLLDLLPEEQRTMEHLEDNLRSPQVQQTLRQLTQALLPDDAGNMDGFYSVLANFNLNSDDRRASETMAAAMTNPIQAFLDAIVASVEKDKEEETKQEDAGDQMEDS